MASQVSTATMSAKEQAEVLLAKVALLQAQAECEEHKEQEQIEREEWEHAEWKEHEKIEAARVAAEKEEAWKAWRAEKWKAAEEVIEGEEVVVVEGPSEEPRLKKRVRTAESNTGPDGEPEMEAAETACKRWVVTCQRFSSDWFFFRCGQLERGCERVKGGQAKSCLACSKVKQKCVGVVWEGGKGLNRMLIGELTGLLRELVGEMRGSGRS